MTNSFFGKSDINSVISSKPEWYSDILYPWNSVFNEGSNLKNGLIDVSKAYDYVNKIGRGDNHNRKSSLKSSALMDGDHQDYNWDSIDLIPSNQWVEVKTSGKKWSKILEYMKRNPKALMEAIPSSKPNDKLRIAIVPPKYASLKDQLNKIVKPGIPPLHNNWNKSRRKINQSENYRSHAGSQYSIHLTKNMKRKSNQNSAKMVVLKPVPVIQGNSKKNYKFKGNNHLLTFRNIHWQGETEGRKSFQKESKKWRNIHLF